MIIIRLVIPLLFLTACVKTKAKYSQEKSLAVSYSGPRPEQGTCMTWTTIMSEASKKILESSKYKDLLGEGMIPGRCPDTLKVLNVDAKIIKKCDIYQDKSDGPPATYEWFIYDHHVVDGKLVPIGAAEADEICKQTPGFWEAADTSAS